MIKNLSKEYRSALNDFLANGSETILESAYLLGRQALEQGIGVLDIVTVHHQALMALLRRPEESSTYKTRTINRARKFLVESLSPFEMAQRGFRESIAALNALNARLEDEVEQRTQAARLSEERYRTLIEVSPDAITMTDFDGNVLLCNLQAAQLHGYSNSDEFLGKNTTGSVAPEDMPNIMQMVENILRDGIIGNVEYTLIRSDGKRIPVEVRTTVVLDENGKPAGFIGINRDISDRKYAQLKLEAQERRQAALADLGLRALSDVDTNTLMQDAANIVSQTLEVEYCELLELLPEKNGLILRKGIGWKDEAIGNTIITKGTNSQAGYTLMKSKPVIVNDLPSEKRFAPAPFLLEHNILAGMTVIIYSKNQPYGILGAHTAQQRQFTQDDAHFLQSIANILAMAIDNRTFLATESRARERAEEEREQALKSLAFVSHELRTPLTSIKGFASTLLADDVTWSLDQQRDFIQTINEEANKLDDFIDQLLDLSKMGAGIFKFSSGQQTVESLVGTVLKDLQAITRQHNLVINIPNSLPDVIADPQRCGQVLVNLVENATKYAPTGTLICISAHSYENFVEFSVADQGPGISPNERENIFEPFYRIGNKATAKAKGAGLGLTICRKLIEGQGGRIWIAESAEPGAIINFTLPLAHHAKKQSELS